MFCVFSCTCPVSAYYPITTQAAKLRRTMINSEAAKTKRRMANSAPGAVVVKPERRRNIVSEVE